MAQDFARAFYHSPAWRKNRKNYLMRPLETPMGICPPGMCERCFEIGELKPATVVHHKEHLTPQNINDPHVTLKYDNLQRLCVDCHAAVHSGRRGRRVDFDDDGQPAPKEPETFEATVMRLTETVDERRNIHSNGDRHE